jgi:hypothetical protein
MCIPKYPRNRRFNPFLPEVDIQSTLPIVSASLCIAHRRTESAQAVNSTTLLRSSNARDDMFSGMGAQFDDHLSLTEHAATGVRDQDEAFQISLEGMAATYSTERRTAGNH